MAKQDAQKQQKPPAAAEPPAPVNRLRPEWVALGAILVVAAILRIYSLGDAPFEYDELWTAELSTGRGSVHLTAPRGELLNPAPATTQVDSAPGFWRVWTNMETATHPPLYFALLGLWRTIFGEGVVVARALSVLCSLASIALLFELARRLHGLIPAFWAAAIMAVASPQIEYARQARNYAFLLMLALAAALSLVRIEQRGASWGRLIVLGLALLATTLTHYFSLGLLLGLFIYGMIRMRGKDRLRVLAAFAAAGLLFLILWGAFLLDHLRRFSGGDATTAFLAAQDVSWLALVLSLPARMLYEPPTLAWWVMLGGVLYAAPFFLLRWRPKLLLAAIWVVSSAAFVALLDLTRDTSHVLHVRYFLLAGPGVYLILSSLFERERTPVPHLLPGLAVLICLLALPNVYESREADWKVLADAVDERTGADDLLVFYDVDPPGGPGDPFLGFSHHSSLPVSHPIVLLDRSATPGLLDELKHRPRFWLVYGSTQLSPEQLLPGFRAESRLDLEGVPARLYVMSRNPSSP